MKSTKTLKFTARHDAIADDYRNGASIRALAHRYGLSRTWINHVIYCYGLAPRTKLTEETDPLNYARLQRHLKRQRSRHESHQGTLQSGPS